MKKFTLINAIRSNTFAIWIAILSVIVQSFHSYTAFYNTSSLQNIWGISQAVLFSLVIDLAILFYTVRGRKDIARLAALIMVIINCYYYYKHLGLSFEFIFGVFLSLIIPVSVYFYSEEIPKGEEPGDLERVINANQNLAARTKAAEDLAHNLKRALLDRDNKLAEYEKVEELQKDFREAILGDEVRDKSLLDIEEEDKDEFVILTDGPPKYREDHSIQESKQDKPASGSVPRSDRPVKD